MPSGDIEKKFGFLAIELRLAREQRGISQQQLANRIGRSLADIISIECGGLKDEFGTVYLICDELGVNFKSLFKEEARDSVVLPFPVRAQTR